MRRDVLLQLIALAREVHYTLDDGCVDSQVEALDPHYEGSVLITREHADELGKILDWFDDLPDGDNPNVIESGPGKVERLMDTPVVAVAFKTDLLEVEACRMVKAYLYRPNPAGVDAHRIGIVTMDETGAQEIRDAQEKELNEALRSIYPKSRCGCGHSWKLGILHRAGKPCFVPDAKFMPEEGQG